LGIEDPHIKLRASMTSAALQAPLETLSNWVAVSKIMKANGTWSKWLVSTLETAAGEGATEFVQQFPDEYATMMALNPDVSQKDLLSWAVANKDKIFGEALYAGAVGAATGAVMGGAGGGAKIAVDRLIHPKQAKANQERNDRMAVLVDKAEAGTLTPDEQAELGAVSEEQVAELVKAVKKNVELNKPIETPEREAVKTALDKKVGAEKAEAEIQVFDAVARSWADRTGNTPDKFYSDVVGVQADTAEPVGTEADLFQPIEKNSAVSLNDVHKWERSNYFDENGNAYSDPIFTVATSKKVAKLDAAEARRTIPAGLIVRIERWNLSTGEID
jgi:hypothetical protein